MMDNQPLVQSIAIVLAVVGGLLLLVASLTLIAGRNAHDEALLADAGGPYSAAGHPDLGLYTGQEGETILLDASGSSFGRSPISRYEWDVDGDGIFDLISGESTIETTFADDFYGQVTLRVTNTEGQTDEAQAPIMITDVPPTVDFMPVPGVVAGQPLRHEVTIYEPGDDPVWVRVGYGDGTTDWWQFPSTVAEKRLTLQHVYDLPGDYRLVVEVLDENCEGMEREATVRVAPACESPPLNARFQPPHTLGEAGERISLRVYEEGKAMDRLEMEVRSLEGSTLPLGNMKASTGDCAWETTIELQCDSTWVLTAVPVDTESSVCGAPTDIELMLCGPVDDAVVTIWSVRAFFSDGTYRLIELYHLTYPQRLIAGIPCFVFFTRTSYSWMPENSNQCIHLAFVVYPWPQTIQFRLSGVSTEPGDALNHPQVGADRNLDLQFVQGDQWDPQIQVIDQTSARTRWPTWFALITTTSYDFGSYGEITATACGINVGPRKIPRDDVPAPGGNHIADVWDARHPANPREIADDDATPAGNGTVGDGFSRYEEYRGFYEAGGHVRTDPAVKDVFILDVNRMGIGNFPALGYAIHANITNVEVARITRQVDFQQGTARTTNHGTTDQFAIQLTNAPVAVIPIAMAGGVIRTPGMTVARGVAGAYYPTDAPSCLIDVTAVSAAPPGGMRGAGVPVAGALNWVIGHELGHAVGLDPPPGGHAHAMWKGCTMNARIPISAPAGLALPGGYCAVAAPDGFDCVTRHAARR